MKEINVVAGIISNNNEILCTKRDIGKYDYVSLKYEFPGGKIEEGETYEETLHRELMEELELEVFNLKYFDKFSFDYPDFRVNMIVYTCECKNRDIKLNVHKDFKWLKKEDLRTLDWAGVDILVVDKFLEK